MKVTHKAGGDVVNVERDQNPDRFDTALCDLVHTVGVAKVVVVYSNGNSTEYSR